MWILYAFGSALFAGATSILAKIGIEEVDSHLATALRTIVVLVFSWLMVFIVGSQNQLTAISIKSYVFLILSGMATGASWLCYFKALQLGDVNKVVPIDKSSTILTMILAFVFLKEDITIPMISGMIAIGIGTYLMIQKKEEEQKQVKNKIWLIYAVLSAVFASLTSILAKVGIENVESNLGTAIRTIVVLIMAWIIVFLQKKHGQVKNISKKSFVFIGLSGIATGASWICYYKALHDGLASIVVPIDKLSILVTVAFAYIFLREKLSRSSMIQLFIIRIRKIKQRPTIILNLQMDI